MYNFFILKYNHDAVITNGDTGIKACIICIAAFSGGVNFPPTSESAVFNTYNYGTGFAMEGNLANPGIISGSYQILPLCPYYII